MLLLSSILPCGHPSFPTFFPTGIDLWNANFPLSFCWCVGLPL
jgi:hypothetical protein